MIANEFIVDSGNISVKIHGLGTDGYLVDVVTPIARMNFGCPGGVSEKAAARLLSNIQEAINDGELNMVGDFDCNERRRG